MNIKLHISA